MAEKRQRTMTLSDAATPFGCCNFFDICNDGLMSLHYNGRLPLLDWMGFNVSDECYRTLEFIAWRRPEYEQGVPTGGYISDPCADPNGVEFGSCKITVEDFGEYGRMGPVREVLKPKKWCKSSPRYRLDGTLVENEDEWDMVNITDVIVQDVSKALVSGNATTPGQFDGLQRWVRTGYTGCRMLDAAVINWNANPLAGGAGMTWNGAAINPNSDFIDVLLAAYRRIRQRISWAPMLAAQQMRLGDMILVMPDFMVQCLLDYFTCWSVCEGRQYNEANLQTYEARMFRNQLLGGLFGYGQISLDGFPIPILSYDWDMILGPSRADIYLLTGSVGPMRIWEGEFLDANVAVRENPGQGYFISDGGRLLGRKDSENKCKQLKMWMDLRLFCKAPWAQVRFQNVRCTPVVDPLSPDPTETSFFPESSFEPAECP